jgi:hypothetical protein
MSNTIPINIVVEDVLSEVVAKTILGKINRKFYIGTCYGKQGFGYIKRNIPAFNNAAKGGTPYLVLTDLDRKECAPLLIGQWLSIPKYDNLIFRVAVREIESWVLADRKEFAKFIGISKNKIPSNTDEINDPKEFLINLARKSRKTNLRKAIVPEDGISAIIGPNYNHALIDFITSKWRINEAKKNSPSLKRALMAINSFRPSWD